MKTGDSSGNGAGGDGYYGIRFVQSDSTQYAGYLLVDATRRYWNAMAEVAALQRGVMLDARAADVPALGGAGERTTDAAH